jgi:hypothetical protein
MKIRQLSLGKHVDMVNIGLILFGQNFITGIFSDLGSRGQHRKIVSGEKFKMWYVCKVIEDLFVHDNPK